jgi:hypothetical protein
VARAGRGSRWLLFTVFLFTVPVLYYLGVVERAPTVRLLFLSALCAGVALTEGAVHFQGVFAWLGLGQSLIWVAGLWLAAGVVARLLGRVPGRAPRRWLLAALCGGLLAVSLLPIYRTPMSSHAAWSSLRGIFG